MKTRCASMLLLGSALLLSGCGNPDRLLPTPIEHTPLALDPTDEWSVTRWWSNGSRLIRFDENGAYTMFPGLNRYDDPVQRGRWVKESYARVILEPYQALRTERLRVGVDRIDGRIAMRVPGSEPFVAIEGPPIMPEDGLLGRWRSDRHELTLSGDRRFRLTHRLSGEDEPLLLTSSEGRWRLLNTSLILEPNAIGSAEVVLAVHAKDDGPVLQMDEHRLLRR